jgi:hypothetical protein
MSVRRQLAEQDIEARRYEHGDSVTLVADLGDAGSGSVDVVGDTAIVVVDNEQFEFEIEREAKALINNGVLTIEVSA